MDKLVSQTEVKRAQVLDTLKEGEISQLEAARRIGVSTRQARRLPNVTCAKGWPG